MPNRRVIWCWLPLALWSALALAQGTTAIRGFVECGDVPLPGVAVTAIHQATGIQRTTVTSASGRFEFPLLQPGQYELRCLVLDGPPLVVAVAPGEIREVVLRPACPDDPPPPPQGNPPPPTHVFLNFGGDAGFPSLTVTSDTTGLAPFDGSASRLTPDETAYVIQRIVDSVREDYKDFNIRFATSTADAGPSYFTWGIDDTSFIYPTDDPDCKFPLDSEYCRLYGKAGGNPNAPAGSTPYPTYARTWARSFALTPNPYAISLPPLIPYSHCTAEERHPQTGFYCGRITTTGSHVAITPDHVARALANSAAHEISHLFGTLHHGDVDPVTGLVIEAKGTLLYSEAEGTEALHDKVFGPDNYNLLMRSLGAAPPENPVVSSTTHRKGQPSCEPSMALQWMTPYSVRGVGGYSYSIVSQDDPYYNEKRTPDWGVDLDSAATSFTTPPLEPGHVWEFNIRTIDADGQPGRFYSSFWAEIDSCAVEITRPRAGDDVTAGDWVDVYWNSISYGGNDVTAGYDVESLDLMNGVDFVQTLVTNQPNILWAGFPAPIVGAGGYRVRLILDRNWAGDMFPDLPETFIGFSGTFSISGGTPPPNTPTGSSVIVQPVDSVTGLAPVTVTFGGVEVAGDTTLSTSDVSPGPPSTFAIACEPTLYLDLQTSAVLAPGSIIKVCVNYGTWACDESRLALNHFEDTDGDGIKDAWVDATLSLDVENDIICGEVGSLSPFALFRVNRPPRAVAGPDQVLQCDRDLQGTASLDGSASWDPDSTPGTNDDIVSFSWSENGQPIASGRQASAALALGLHDLVLSVVDQAGTGGTDGAAVTVQDTQPPQITCPPSVTIECQGDGQAEALLASARALDSCEPTVDIANSRSAGGPDASGFYPLGSTTVTFTALDAASNAATCDTTVSVVDTTAPVAAVVASPNVLWPPNHRMISVAVDYHATDNCRTPACRISSVTCNEPISQLDYAIPDPYHVTLRASRLGTGTGRVYTVTLTCDDGSGNSVVQAATVTVPHDKGR